MKYSTKVLLGILSFWPVAYVLLFIAFVLAFILLADSGSAPPEFAAEFILVFVLHFLTILTTLGLTVYYIIHAMRDETLTRDRKIMWIFLNVLAGMLCHPAYWYLRIWRDAEPEANHIELSPPPAQSWMDTGDIHSRSGRIANQWQGRDQPE